MDGRRQREPRHAPRRGVCVSTRQMLPPDWFGFVVDAAATASVAIGVVAYRWVPSVAACDEVPQSSRKPKKKLLLQERAPINARRPSPRTTCKPAGVRAT